MAASWEGTAVWKAIAEIAALVRSPLTFFMFSLVLAFGSWAIALKFDSATLQTTLVWFGILYAGATSVTVCTMAIRCPEKLYGLRDWANDENFMRAMGIIKPELRKAIQESDEPDSLGLLRASIELYAVQHNGQYPNFADNGWQELIDEHYLVEPPRNPESPDGVATRDDVPEIASRHGGRRGSRSVPTVGSSVATNGSVATKVLVTEQLTGEDVDPAEAGWVWNDKKKGLYLAGTIG